jgi:hypothetical protein
MHTSATGPLDAWQSREWGNDVASGELSYVGLCGPEGS